MDPRSNAVKSLNLPHVWSKELTLHRFKTVTEAFHCANPEANGSAAMDDAMRNAEMEEMRLQFERKQKEEKLQEFQVKVKQRVKDMDRLKKIAQAKKSHDVMENELKIIQQSIAASERHIPFSNRCSLRRNDEHLVIQAGKDKGGEKGLDGEKFAKQIDHQDLKNAENLKTGKNYKDMSSEIFCNSRSARKNLASRKLLTERMLAKSQTDQTLKESSYDKSSSSSQDENEMTEESSNGREITNKEMCKNHRPISATNAKGYVDIYPHQRKHDSQQTNGSQRALYRRLFMDIEREQVKEVQRRREHQQRMQSLKDEKEQLRRQMESVDVSSKACYKHNALSRKKNKAEQVVEELQENERKHKENMRFIEALKASLKEKLEKSGIEPPALCSCAPNFWLTNPSTCANNCLFHNNVKEYIKALQGILSCEI